MKHYRRWIYVMIAVTAANLAAMAWQVGTLPDIVPGHFNLWCEVDRMGSKWFLMIFPAVDLLFAVGVAVEQRIRGDGYVNNKPLTIFAASFVALFMLLGWMAFALCSTGAQLGDVVDVPFDLAICLGLSLLIVVMGNYLPTVQRNHTFGIRFSATLESDTVWRRTHRFAGVAYVLGGGLSAVLVLVGYFTGLKWLELVGLVTCILGVNVVIYIYARREAVRVKWEGEE